LLLLYLFLAKINYYFSHSGRSSLLVGLISGVSFACGFGFFGVGAPDFFAFLGCFEPTSSISRAVSVCSSVAITGVSWTMFGVWCFAGVLVFCGVTVACRVSEGVISVKISGEVTEVGSGAGTIGSVTPASCCLVRSHSGRSSSGVSEDNTGVGSVLVSRAN